MPCVSGNSPFAAVRLIPIRALFAKTLRHTFQDAQNVNSKKPTRYDKQPQTSPPRSPSPRWVRSLPRRLLAERGKKYGAILFPRVEQIASCDLFYPGLMICHPSGVL